MRNVVVKPIKRFDINLKFHSQSWCSCESDGGEFFRRYDKTGSPHRKIVPTRHEAATIKSPWFGKWIVRADKSRAKWMSMTNTVHLILSCDAKTGAMIWLTPSGRVTYGDSRSFIVCYNSFIVCVLLDGRRVVFLETNEGRGWRDAERGMGCYGHCHKTPWSTCLRCRVNGNTVMSLQLFRAALSSEWTHKFYVSKLPTATKKCLLIKTM